MKVELGSVRSWIRFGDVDVGVSFIIDNGGPAFILCSGENGGGFTYNVFNFNDGAVDYLEDDVLVSVTKFKLVEIMEE